MGQSLKAFKSSTLLLEIVKELFDSPAFKTSFNFIPSDYASYETVPFRDPLGNLIRVFFTEIGDELYEVEFDVNGDSFQDQNTGYTVKDYSTLLATVAKAVSRFLEKYNPQGILIKGTDILQKVQKNPKTVGQKDRLYLYFISQIEDRGKYMVDKSNPDGIALMKK